MMASERIWDVHVGVRCQPAVGNVSFLGELLESRGDAEEGREQPVGPARRVDQRLEQVEDALGEVAADGVHRHELGAC